MGTAQICWLSELTLYNFDIIYRTRKSNLVVNALSHRPEVQEEVYLYQESIPDEDEGEWIAVSYKVADERGCISLAKFNNAISELVGSTKIKKKLEDCIQAVNQAKD